MTEEQHREFIRTLATTLERDLKQIARSSFQDLQDGLDAAIADGIPASRCPPEFRAHGFLRPTMGECFLDQLARRIDRDNWR